MNNLVNAEFRYLININLNEVGISNKEIGKTIYEVASAASEEEISASSEMLSDNVLIKYNGLSNMIEVLADSVSKFEV